MDGKRTKSDAARWPMLLKDATDPVFVLNRRRRIVFVNSAWERLTQMVASDARGLTCTNRESRHVGAALARVLAPPDEVFAGQSASIRRAPPNAVAGPPWWDIDFVPLMADGRFSGAIGRVQTRGQVDNPSRPVLPAAWGQLRANAVRRFGYSLWESNHSEIRRAVAQARLTSASGCCALLIGEKGTGKLTLARTIHAQSPRSEQPCVCLDATRLPIDAIRQLLLTTPAQQFVDSIGLLYMHEPGLLPTELQQEIVQRLTPRVPLLTGCTVDPRLSNARRIAPELIEASTVVIELSPLRQRMIDLPRFIDEFSRRKPNTSMPIRFSQAALAMLMEYQWPGNLDQLHQVIHELNPQGDVEIEPADLPFAIRQAPAAVVERTAPMLPLDELLERVEIRMVRLALERAKGNKSKAAEMLGIWRPRLLRRLEGLGMNQREGES